VAGQRRRAARRGESSQTMCVSDTAAAAAAAAAAINYQLQNIAPTVTPIGLRYTIAPLSLMRSAETIRPLGILVNKNENEND